MLVVFDWKLNSGMHSRRKLLVKLGKLCCDNMKNKAWKPPQRLTNDRSTAVSWWHGGSYSAHEQCCECPGAGVSEDMRTRQRERERPF